MKYLQNGGYQNNPLMRLTLVFASVFLAGFVVTNFMLYFSKMDLTPASVVTYYRGSEEQFLPERSYLSMLEVTHGHLPMMALVLLLLTHLVLFAPLSSGWKLALVVTPFTAGLTGEASGWLVRFVDPGFAALKVASFLVLQASMITLLVILGIFLLTSSGGTSHERDEKRNGSSKRKGDGAQGVSRRPESRGHVKRVEAQL
jgi:hypothetical protein